MKKSELKHSIVSTDLVLFTYTENKLKVFLIDVLNKEYAGKKAFPGGLVLINENAEQAKNRIVKNKLKIDNKKIYSEELGSFSEVDRDKRGRVVSIAYVGLLNVKDFDEKECSNNLFEISKAKNLAYDHDLMLKKAIKKMQDMFLNTTVAGKLLDKYFTISELMNLYNTVLDRNIDKRNFSKKIKSLNIIRETGKMLSGMKNRPAKLYEFKDKNIKQLEIF